MNSSSVYSCASDGRRHRRLLLLTGVASIGWLLCMAGAIAHGDWKLLSLSLFGAAVFLAGSAMAMNPHYERYQPLIAALASGAIIASAVFFVMPEALTDHPGTGLLGTVLGLAFGLLVERSTPRDTGTPVLAALSLHSLFEGVVMGLLYVALPSLTIGVGLAIIAHKLPAGFLLARQLEGAHRPRHVVLLPALAVGLGALPVAWWRPDNLLPAGLTFGIGSGLFLFVALVFASRLANNGRARPSLFAAAAAAGMVVAVLALSGLAVG